MTTTTDDSTGALCVWEARWVANVLPPQFDVAVLSRRFRMHVPAIGEDDVYLDTGSPDVNLKLRRRTNALKLKTLRRSADRCEEWATDIDKPLPAGENSFAAVLRLMGAAADAKRLATAPTVQEALALLGPVIGAHRLVPVVKTRHQFVQGNCRIDRADFVVAGRPLQTLGVESHELVALQEMLGRLETHTLGPARNYVEELFGAVQPRPGDSDARRRCE